MTPIVIHLRGDNTPEASAPVAGQLSWEQHDESLASLKLASEELDTEKVGFDDAIDVEAGTAPVVNTDVLTLTRAGIPYDFTVEQLLAPTLGDIETLLAAL